MNLVVNILSSDFKKNGAGFIDDWFWGSSTPPHMGGSTPPHMGGSTPPHMGGSWVWKRLLNSKGPSPWVRNRLLDRLGLVGKD